MSALCPRHWVICIDGKFAPDVCEWVDAIPREGEIYTIQRVYDGKNRRSSPCPPRERSMPSSAGAYRRP